MKHIKTRTINAAMNSSLFSFFVSCLEALDDFPADTLRILTYHRIDDPLNQPHLYPGLCIPPAVFTQQLEFLATNYTLVSAELILKSLSSPNPEPLPPRAVLITFDDGYKDFLENAWPILKSYHVPAILFVPTSYPDHPERSFWWDSLYHILSITSEEKLSTGFGDFIFTTPADRMAAYKQIRDFLTRIPHTETIQFLSQLSIDLDVSPIENHILSWADLRKLSSEGLAMGAHTQTHPRLDQVSTQVAKLEIEASIRDLSENLGSPDGCLPLFAYPGGGVTEEVVELLRNLGIKAAFTTERGINHFSKDNPLRLRRINIGKRTNIALLKAQLLYRSYKVWSRFV